MVILEGFNELDEAPSSSHGIPSLLPPFDLPFHDIYFITLNKNYFALLYRMTSLASFLVGGLD